MRLLVCGGRDYQGDVTCLEALLPDIEILIHGGANGADMRAATWATSHGVHTALVSALWKSYGKAAGFKRNTAMLLLQPTYCVAFPGGAGTRMMADLCRRNKITVWEPYLKNSNA